MTDIFLGLDLGTSGCKLIAFDGNSKELGRATRRYAIANPGPGQFELDAAKVWAQAEACFQEIDVRSLTGQVRSLSISVLGEAIVPVDRSGRALAPAPISADMRSTAELARLAEQFDGEAFYAITGQPLSCTPALPKLMWWNTHRPDVIASAWKFLCFGEFALMQLGLPPVIDEGMAARTGAYDIGARAWSAPLLKLAGLAPGQLADVAPSGTILGTVSAAAATRLALPDGVKIVLGGHDQPMGALGAGIVEGGMAIYSLGTTEALVVALAARSPALGAANIPCYPHVILDRYVGLAGNQSGSRVLSWYRETMTIGETLGSDVQAFDLFLASLKDEMPTWPILLPHFAGSGSVLNDPHSMGALFGLRFETTRSDILLGLLEGITFEQALSLEALSQTTGPVTALRAIGGGTRSSLWLQMKADILGLPITRITVQDASCLGAAILGRGALEPDRTLADIAATMVTTGQTFRPRPDRHAAHAARFAIYRRLYHALRPLAGELQETWKSDADGPQVLPV